MHFLTLVTVNIPPQELDPEMDQYIADQAAMLQQRKEASSKLDSCLLDICLEKCNSLQNSFSRAVDYTVAEVMERYWLETENPDYLEFCDRTEEIKNEYSTAKMDCFKLADGQIIPYYTRLGSQFVIKNGVVYKKECGPLRHEKRNKQAKRMKALPDYPVSKLCPTLEDYAIEYHGCHYHEEQNGYGYYYNPDGFWDWYSIGGRWPELFLVKNECQECSIGERSWTCEDNLAKAPEGYKWVCAARKKDIEWQALRDWTLQKKKEYFRSLEKLFYTGERDKNIYGTVTEDGIQNWNGLIYHKGESESDYLARCGYSESDRFTIYPYDYLNADEYRTQQDITVGTPEGAADSTKSWQKALEDYIDSLEDDTVLVGVDHHE